MHSIHNNAGYWEAPEKQYLAGNSAVMHASLIKPLEALCLHELLAGHMMVAMASPMHRYSIPARLHVNIARLQLTKHLTQFLLAQATGNLLWEHLVQMHLVVGDPHKVNLPCKVYGIWCRERNGQGRPRDGGYLPLGSCHWSPRCLQRTYW